MGNSSWTESENLAERAWDQDSLQNEKAIWLPIFLSSPPLPHD